MNMEEEIQALKTLKLDRCRQENGPTDVMPTIKVAIGDIMVVIPVVGDDTPAENVKKALGGLLAFMKENQNNFKWDSMSYCTEAFVRKTPEIKNYRRGELEEEYKTNPESDVTQCIILSVFKWEGNDELAVIEYGYNDFGMPEFSQFTIGNDAMGGEVVNVFKKFAMYCRYLEDREPVI